MWFLGFTLVHSNLEQIVVWQNSTARQDESALFPEIHSWSAPHCSTLLYNALECFAPTTPPSSDKCPPTVFSFLPPKNISMIFSLSAIVLEHNWYLDNISYISIRIYPPKNISMIFSLYAIVSRKSCAPTARRMNQHFFPENHYSVLSPRYFAKSPQGYGLLY